MKDFVRVQKPHHILFLKRKENVQHDEAYLSMDVMKIYLCMENFVASKCWFDALAQAPFLSILLLLTWGHFWSLMWSHLEFLVDTKKIEKSYKFS